MWNEGAVICHYAIWIFLRLNVRVLVEEELELVQNLRRQAAVEKGYMDGVGEELLRVAPEMAQRNGARSSLL